jgi:hypothetical protein
MSEDTCPTCLHEISGDVAEFDGEIDITMYCPNPDCPTYEVSTAVVVGPDD